jgi:ribosomal protein L6P/L9E
MQLKSNLPTEYQANFYFFKKTKLLNLIKPQELHYIAIPGFINLQKDNSNLLLNSLDNNYRQEGYSFFKIFNSWLKNIKKPVKKKLYFKGLGLKFRIINKTLELKLGFSHLILISLQNLKLKVKTTKNAIIVRGSNLVQVGTFLNKIRDFKYPNIYKGKGIWYKGEVRKLKPIKKT